MVSVPMNLLKYNARPFWGSSNFTVQFLQALEKHSGSTTSVRHPAPVLASLTKELMLHPNLSGGITSMH